METIILNLKKAGRRGRKDDWCKKHELCYNRHACCPFHGEDMNCGYDTFYIASGWKENAAPDDMVLQIVSSSVAYAQVEARTHIAVI